MRVSHTRLSRSHAVRAMIVWVCTTLMVPVLALALAACGGEGTTPTSVTGSPSSSKTLPLPTTTTPPTVVTNPESQKYMAMLKETYDAANEVSRAMEQRGASSTDPDAAKVYALRARAQAITARKAMVDNEPGLADAATVQMRKLLTQAQGRAQSPVLEMVQTALASSDGIPAPSQSAEQAAAMLEVVIQDLSALIPAGEPTGS